MSLKKFIVFCMKVLQQRRPGSLYWLRFGFQTFLIVDLNVMYCILIEATLFLYFRPKIYCGAQKIQKYFMRGVVQDRIQLRYYPTSCYVLFCDPNIIRKNVCRVEDCRVLESAIKKTWCVRPIWKGLWLFIVLFKTEFLLYLNLAAVVNFFYDRNVLF